MPTRKLEEKNIRKLTKIGKKSIGLTLPIEIVKALGWRERQNVLVKKIRKGVIIRDHRSK